MLDFLRVACVFIALLPSACALLRPATDLPETFSFDAASLAGSNRPARCSNPIIDPRDGTELRLVRERQYRHGDYLPDRAGRYGVGRGELLRLDCNTGEIVGIVPR